MDTQKRGSVFGSVLVVVILVGLVLFYLTRNNSTRTSDLSQNETAGENTPETQNQTTQMENETSADAEFEAEVETLDTEFEDMDPEDLDI